MRWSYLWQVSSGWITESAPGSGSRDCGGGALVRKLLVLWQVVWSRSGAG
jgi:hypothetical protein